MKGAERDAVTARTESRTGNAVTGPVAAVEIGSTGIRMMVATIDVSGDFKVLDRAGKPSRIGRDVFTAGHITREGMREVVAVLSSFRELLRGYGIEPSQARVIGTSALREAANRDTFVERISLQTGFKVRVLEEIEEHHLMYLAVQQALHDEQKTLTRSNAMVLEVGGGTTAVMLLRRGRMAATHTLRIGTLRLDEQMREAGTPKTYLRQFLESNVRSACDFLDDDLPLDSARTPASPPIACRGRHSEPTRSWNESVLRNSPRPSRD
jgi:exopolyphosphatase/guanosine-5'-triphosphate,3'-diphosphate pyrophosphatase